MSKSAPVLLPNAKKPSLLMRLFSTERKSSLYVMPTSEDGDDTGGDKSRQHKRHAKRLQSVDSATMQRDREALIRERRQLHSQQRQDAANASASEAGGENSPKSPPPPPPPSSSSSSHPPTSARRSVDSQHVRPSSATAGSGNGSSASESGRRKQSMPVSLKIQLNPKTATATGEKSPGDKTTKSPTGSDRSPSSASSNGASSDASHPQSPTSPTSAQKKHSLQGGASTPTTKSAAGKSPTGSPKSDATKPPMSPSASVDGISSSAKRESVSKKRSSVPTDASPSAAEQQQQQQQTSKPGGSKPRKSNRKLKHRKQRTQQASEIKVDVSKPLEFPTTPDIISEYHRQKPFLNRNEEWLIVELLEYECLVDGLEIIRTIAKHSKFFEVEPDELWEEFFEFVENVPSYDEIINYDVWQEFLLEKYNC